MGHFLPAVFVSGTVVQQWICSSQEGCLIFFFFNNWKCLKENQFSSPPRPPQPSLSRGKMPHVGKVCYLPAFPPGARCVAEVEHILFVFTIHLCGVFFFF